MNSHWGAHASAQKITEMTKSLKICCTFDTNHIHFKIIHRWTEMMHQQRVSRSGSSIIERTVGKSHQSTSCVCAEGGHLSTCSNKNDVM